MDPTLQKGQYVNKRFRADPGDVQVKDVDDGDGGRKRIRMPVSSTATDRDGDQFSEKGLKDLRDQINEGNVPMFLDHGRGSRGGYYGTLGMVGRWDSAEIDDQGDVKVLYAEGTPTKANEDADAMVALIEDDMPVGSSVGFRILDYEGDRTEGYQFHKSDLLEISNVGIPSNPLTVNTIGGDAGVEAKDAGAFGPALLQMMQAQASAAQAALPDDQEYSFQTNSAATPETTMSDTDNDNDTNDDLLERLVSLQERTVEKMDEQDDRLKELEARLDEQKDEGDGESKDDDEEEDDEKSVTIVAGADADEATIKRIKEMREVANDDGEIDLAESKTTLFANDDDTDDQTDDPRKEWDL